MVERIMDRTITPLTSMTDDELLACVTALSGREKRTTAQLIAALAELDSRRLYLPQGYASLFAYCRDALGLSEDAAYNRMRAAKVAARWPAIVDMIANGSLTLTAVRLLADLLTDENHEALLGRAMHKTKREVEALVAEVAPHRFQFSTVRQVGPERFTIEITIDRQTHDRLRELQDLWRHRIPSGDPAAIVSLAVRVLLEDVRRKRLAETSRPRRVSRPLSISRHIPAAVRRAVWERDGGRRAYVGKSGRCTERAFLEVHHVRPFAEGGRTTIDNLELRCRAHNAYESEEHFGPWLARETPAGYDSTVDSVEMAQ